MSRIVMKELGIVWVVSFVFLAPLAVRAHDTPYNPNAPARASGPANACGLVETTFDDPDWVLVASDLILRSNLCVAPTAECPTCWYDRVFNPCHVDNRYWKVQPDSGSAFVYPMAELGVGSFDGLYIRVNSKFQIYSGTGDANPFGPLMTGPKYVSIDHWVTVNPAPNGLEPGTFVVKGDIGALSEYSIKIGGDVEVLEIDAKEKDNEKDHHTDKFTDDYVLRRGTTFDVEVKLSKEYGPGCHDIYFEATHDFDGATTTIDIPAFETAVPADQWGAQRISVTTNGDKTKTVKIKITIPGDVAIDKHTFKGFVREKGETDPDSEKQFDKPVVILFNPWSTQDDVFLGTANQRDEYVLNENGQIWGIWADPDHPTKAWRYMQFDKTNFKVTLGLLSGVSATNRAKPIVVSRHLSAVVNSNGGGVVFGKWIPPYTGGKKPGKWSGSDEILSAYDSSGGAAVKYGQCWVFAGVLNTVLRCVGIPSRPLSNFESAHDEHSPPNKKIDWYFDKTASGGYKFNKAMSEGVWNFHVWCDAWMKRPDLTGHDGWQAVDATPQETSGGEYQLGPAPVSAVRGDKGGNYDVDFVFAEVDADVLEHRETAVGSGDYDLHSTDTTHVGRNITTKAVGGDAAQDITASYKTAPFSSASRGTITLPDSGIEVNVDAPNTVSLGSDIVWTVALDNPTGTARSIVVVIAGTAVAYDGSFISDVDEVDVTVSLDPGANDSVALVIPPALYTTWTGATSTFQVSLAVVVIGTTDLVLDLKRSILTSASVVLNLTPNVPIVVGESVAIQAQFTNPLPSDLTAVIVTYSVGDALQIDGGLTSQINVGTVAVGQSIDVSKDVLGVLPGTHQVAVTIDANELHNVFADASIEVGADCNTNGVEDAIDIAGGASLDCNTNGVPDECESDCDANTVPDDCDISLGTAPDCNANNVPDECDLTAGTSFDCSGNGIPDECDPFYDCNGNELQDLCELAAGTSQDCNNNTVPDECDVVVFPPRQVAKLAGADTAAGDEFGTSVAISGTRAVVGAPLDDHAGGIDAGSAYVFGQDGTGWVQEAKLTAADAEAGDAFGASVSIAGDRAVVAAYRDDDACPGDPDCDSGSVYVFGRDDNGTPSDPNDDFWVEETKLTALDAEAGDLFGWSAAISGDLLVVIAPGNDSAYVFRREGTTWIQEDNFTVTGVTPLPYGFGQSVAISGDWIVVGNLSDGPAGFNTGSAFVFHREGTTWIQETQLIPSDAAENDWFGWSVAISGMRAVVGAWRFANTPPRSGAAYVFRRAGTTWVEEAKLTASDAAQDDWLGWSVAISDHLIVAGSKSDDHAGGIDAGAAYLFGQDGTTWFPPAKLVAADATAGDRFGQSVSINGNWALAGAWWDDDGGIRSGSAYVYEVRASDCNLNAVPDECDIALGTSSDCNNNAIPDECGIGILRFLETESIDLGTPSSGIAAGDLNLDGHVDLVIASIVKESISILFNHGDGTFADAVIVNLGVIFTPWAVEIADLNGDGPDDIVVTDEHGRIAVLLNDGVGNFSSSTPYYAYGKLQGVSIADLDGDGDLDIASADGSSDQVWVFSNAGDGTFGTQVAYSVGGYPFGVAIGDLNGDTAPDLAVANRTSNDVSVLLNNGDGSFGTQVTYAAGLGAYSVGIADLDGDGDADLAVSNKVANTIAVLLNNGDGTFSDEVSYPVGSSPRMLDIADMDGDGDPDLVVPNMYSGTVSVLANLGNGRFADAVTIAPTGSGSGPFAVRAAMLDGDDVLDLAVTTWAGDSVSVLVNVSFPPVSQDCNDNGVPDECDIAATSSIDCNSNGVPDECEVFLLDPVLMPGGEAGYPKSRVISFVPQNVGEQTAIRVTHTATGFQWWLGAPEDISENGGSRQPLNPFPNFKAAPLQCTSYYTDWGALGETIHVYGPDVVPSATYDVQVLHDTCDENDESLFSAPLTVSTAKWGDIVGLLGCPHPSAPEGMVLIVDVTAVADKFSSKACSVIKARADVEPELLDMLINITDMMEVVAAFQSVPYPFSDPQACP